MSSFHHMNSLESILGDGIFKLLQPRNRFRASICKPFKEPRNWSSAWRNRFLGSLNVYKYGLCPLKQFMGTNNRVGIEGCCTGPPEPVFKEPRNRFPAWRAGTTILVVVLSYRSTSLHEAGGIIPRNPFLGSVNVYKYGLRLHRLAEIFLGIDSWAL